MKTDIKKQTADLCRTSEELLRSADVIFGPRHECVRNNITTRVEVTSDQRRTGRTISLSHPEWTLLKRRADAANMSVSGFVRKTLGLNPLNADLCPCPATNEPGTGTGTGGVEDKIWREIENSSPIRRTEGG